MRRPCLSGGGAGAAALRGRRGVRSLERRERLGRAARGRRARVGAADGREDLRLRRAPRLRRGDERPVDDDPRHVLVRRVERVRARGVRLRRGGRDGGGGERVEVSPYAARKRTAISAVPSTPLPPP